MNNRRFYVGASALAVASMVLGACAQPTPQVITKEVIKEVPKEVIKEVPKEVVKEVVKEVQVTAVAPKAKIVRVNAGAYPDNLDPQKMSFVSEVGHARLMYQGLTYINSDGVTEPGAAEKWEYNKDATELTFTLKKGLKYSDGSPLNAKRFEYSVLRNSDPATAGEYAFVTQEFIAGAQDWHDQAGAAAEEKDAAKKKAAEDAAKKAETTTRDAIKALDASGKPCKEGKDGYAQEDCLTFKLKLANPTPFFHTIMGMWVAYPAKEENITAGKDTWWNSSKFQVGNGPFILKSLEPQVRALFTPNPNFSGKKPAYDLEYRYVTESGVAFNAYKANEFDVVALAPEDLKAVRADANLNKEAVIYPGKCTTGLQMNQKFDLFKDKNVRAAVSQAFDREAYTRDLLGGLASPTLTWIPNGTPGHNPQEKRWGFDVAAAKKALAESKYPTQDKVPGGKITLSVSNSTRNVTRAEWIVQQLKANLGWDVTIDKVDPTEYTAKQKKGEMQMFLGGWCEDFPDQQNWMTTYWKSTSFASRIAYKNEALDKLMTEGDQTVDVAKRNDLYKQAQDLLINDVPIAFLYNSATALLVKPNVSGYVKSGQDAIFAGDNAPWTIEVK